MTDSRYPIGRFETKTGPERSDTPKEANCAWTRCSHSTPGTAGITLPTSRRSGNSKVGTRIEDLELTVHRARLLLDP